MTDFEILQRAKQYIDDLSKGKNPLNGEVLPDEDIVNNVRISRCLSYVSGVLDKVIQNGGEVLPPRLPRSQKQEFSLTAEQLASVELDNKSTVSEFVGRLNLLCEESVQRKLKSTDITEWLVDAGLLEVVVGDDGKNRKRPTSDGMIMGIHTETKNGMYGTYEAVYYNREAQQFILDNLAAAVERSRLMRDEKKSARKAKRASKKLDTVKEIDPIPWNQEEDFRLLTYVREGKPIYEIAEIMGRSIESVGNRFKGLRISPANAVVDNPEPDFD